jgi:hypothetical protein
MGLSRVVDVLTIQQIDGRWRVQSVVRGLVKAYEATHLPDALNLLAKDLGESTYRAMEEMCKEGAFVNV